jgi:hypothetical protein
MDSTLADLPAMARGALSTRPLIGEWGWSAVVAAGELRDEPGIARIGSLLLLAAVAVAVYWWRRGDPVDVAIASLLAFLLVTYRFGPQYLLWAVPFLVARPTRGTWPFIAVSSIWAAIGYLTLSRLDELSWWYAHKWWALASLLVVPLVAVALPFGRRRRPRAGTPAATVTGTKEPAPTGVRS